MELKEKLVKVEEVTTDVVQVELCTALVIGKEAFKGSLTDFGYKLRGI